jgi:hypothetical protein
LRFEIHYAWLKIYLLGQEQQAMSNQGSQDDETLRNEIQAAIKAGREVGPDMDEHLADSVLERYREEQAARQKALAPQPPAPPPAPPYQHSAETLARLVLTLAGMALFLGIVLWNPHMWWLVFIVPGLFGFWRWNHWGGPYDRRDRIRARYEERRARLEGRRDAPPIEQV